VGLLTLILKGAIDRRAGFGWSSVKRWILGTLAGAETPLPFEEVLTRSEPFHDGTRSNRQALRCAYQGTQL
jgi:hypothetical protein